LTVLAVPLYHPGVYHRPARLLELPTARPEAAGVECVLGCICRGMAMRTCVCVCVVLLRGPQIVYSLLAPKLKKAFNDRDAMFLLLEAEVDLQGKTSYTMATVRSLRRISRLRFTRRLCSAVSEWTSNHTARHSPIARCLISAREENNPHEATLGPTPPVHTGAQGLGGGGGGGERFPQGDQASQGHGGADAARRPRGV
jgi:hypothetical protein